MIKFFRRIRKSLLASHQSRKYLQYAIGEIILVVIGILIALQINNWNEKRKSKLKANELAAKLKLEMAENVKYLKFTNDGIEHQLSYLKLILNESDTNIDSLLTIPRFGLSPIFYMSSYSQFFDPPSDMYTTALNDGSIRLIDDKKLTELLQKFYQSCKIRLDQIIDEEYAQARELNDYLSRNYGSIFNNNAINSDYEWNAQTTKKLLLSIKNDGVLKYKIMERIELKKARQRFVKQYMKQFENQLKQYH